MKKSIIILAVLALIAAPMFAEATLSASGELTAELDVNLGADDMLTSSDAYGDGVKIGFGAKTGEFTTFNTEAVAATSLTDGEFDATVKMNRFTMTQDLSGALGFSGLGVDMTFGYLDFGGTDKTKDFCKNSEVGNNSTGKYVGAKAALDFGAAALTLGILPSTYTAVGDAAPEFGADLTTSVAIADIAAHFVMVGKTMSAGASTSLAIVDGVSAAIGVKIADLSAAGEMDATAAAKYASGPVSAGLGFKIVALKTMNLGVEGSYMVMDDLKVFANTLVPISDFDMDSLEYAAGLTKTLDTAEYTAEFNQDKKLALKVKATF